MDFKNSKEAAIIAIDTGGSNKVDVYRFINLADNMTLIALPETTYLRDSLNLASNSILFDIRNNMVDYFSKKKNNGSEKLVEIIENIFENNREDNIKDVIAQIKEKIHDDKVKEDLIGVINSKKDRTTGIVFSHTPNKVLYERNASQLTLEVVKLWGMDQNESVVNDLGYLDKINISEDATSTGVPLWLHQFDRFNRLAPIRDEAGREIAIKEIKKMTYIKQIEDITLKILFPEEIPEENIWTLKKFQDKIKNRGNKNG